MDRLVPISLQIANFIHIGCYVVEAFSTKKVPIFRLSEAANQF
jgi:hypothetical protein